MPDCAARLACSSLTVTAGQFQLAAEAAHQRHPHNVFSHLGRSVRRHIPIPARKLSGAQAFLTFGGGERAAGLALAAAAGGLATRTVTVALATGTGYSIIVGAGGAAGGNAGGDSSALGQTVSGGRGGGYNFAAGGDGGSGEVAVPLARVAWTAATAAVEPAAMPAAPRQQPGQHHARVRLARGHAVFQRRLGHGRRAYAG